MADQFVDDVSALDIDPPNEDYWGEYSDAATRKGTPPKGAYYLRMPEKFSYARTQTGGLKINIGPLVVVGGEHDGYEIKYPSAVSTTKFKNSNASSAADVLRNFYSSIGPDGKVIYTGPNPSTKEEWAQAFAAIAGQVTPNPVFCDWEGWDKVARQEYKGARAFPVKADGSPQDFIEVDDGNGGKRRVFANLKPTLRGFAPMARSEAA